MAADDHGHIPYIAILLHHLEEWKASHDGNVPKAYSDKTAFRTLVKNATRTDNPEGGEENFEEAVSAVLKSLNAPEPSSAVKDIFKAPECVIIKDTSPSFWVIAHAIGLFYTKYGVLPVPGAVPDMKARSADYIQLQNVYKAKARRDLAEVLDSVRFLERNAGRTSSPIEDRDVEAFCKNAAHIKLVRGRPFHIVAADGSLQWGDNAKSLGMCIHLRFYHNQLTLRRPQPHRPHLPPPPLPHLPRPRRPHLLHTHPGLLTRVSRIRHRGCNVHRPRPRRRSPASRLRVHRCRGEGPAVEYARGVGAGNGARGGSGAAQCGGVDGRDGESGGDQGGDGAVCAG